MKILLLALLSAPFFTLGQNYDLYHTGNPTSIVTSPQGGVCLMGGASEHDEAMKWFLQRADGGDILVLRASGSDGYNDYMYSQLGISVNSVNTVVFNNANASTDPTVLQLVEEAEAIWFAGGDQWDYISYWRNTAVDSLINVGLQQRNIVIGGTSAGMAIQGAYYFSAENGTVTSSTALNNPYDFDVTVDSAEFLINDYLHDVITDTHYDNPDRKGRHVTFLARILADYGVTGKGIACDEYTAICIDENGLAKAYGEWPTYDESVYFIQPNCELQDYFPEDCSNGNDLQWNHGGEALKVYHIHATIDGANTFDLSDWSTGVGGSWEKWRVINGVLQQSAGDPINCSASLKDKELYFTLAPNPSSEKLNIEANVAMYLIEVFDASGRLLKSWNPLSTSSFTINVDNLKEGMYFIQVNGANHSSFQKL